MQTEITYKVSKTDLDAVLTEKLQGLTKQTVLARYRDRMVSAAAVAEIHDVHRDTVMKYAKAKLIPHSREGKLYKFSLADVLEIDFHDLRKTT